MQDSDSVYETMPPSDALSYAPNSYRIQSTRTNEKYNEVNLLQGQTSPKVSVEVSKFISNMNPLDGVNDPPITSNTIDLLANK